MLWKTGQCRQNIKAVEKFVEFVNDHRNFIALFFKIATSLYAVTGKFPFHWGDDQQQYFNELKT
jgi:hypothetical protein